MPQYTVLINSVWNFVHVSIHALLVMEVQIFPPKDGFLVIVNLALFRLL
jgi:hypothetical protein